MDLTQEQFEENLMAMPEEKQASVMGVVEQSEPDALQNFAEALGVNLIMEGEEPVAEEPVVEEEVAPEEPVLEEVAFHHLLYQSLFQNAQSIRKCKH